MRCGIELAERCFDASYTFYAILSPRRRHLATVADLDRPCDRCIVGARLFDGTVRWFFGLVAGGAKECFGARTSDFALAGADWQRYSTRLQLSEPDDA